MTVITTTSLPYMAARVVGNEVVRDVELTDVVKAEIGDYATRNGFRRLQAPLSVSISFDQIAFRLPEP